MKRAQIKDILTTQLSKYNNSQFDEGTTLAELGIDSMILIQLIVKLCEEANVDISKLDEREIMNIQKVGDISSLIEALL